MCHKPFRVRIVSVIPTSYASTGPLQREDEVRHAVERVMNSLASEWARLSSSTIQIVPHTEMFRPPINKLNKYDEIESPKIADLVGPRDKRDAIAHCVWVLFPDNGKPTSDPHYDSKHKIVWIAYRRKDVIDAAKALSVAVNSGRHTKDVVRRVRHEFKHWLIHTVRRMMDQEVDHKVDGKPRLSSEGIFNRFNPQIVRALADYFVYKQEWEAHP